MISLIINLYTIGYNYLLILINQNQTQLGPNDPVKT